MSVIPSAAARLARGLRVTLDPGRLRHLARHTFTTTAIHALALALAVVALVFALIAAHAGLRLIVPAWAAPLVISAVFVGLALGTWLIARRRASPRYVRPAPLIETPPGDAATTLAVAAALAPLLEAATGAIRERPAETMLTALAAGVIAGRLRQRP